MRRRSALTAQIERFCQRMMLALVCCALAAGMLPTNHSLAGPSAPVEESSEGGDSPIEDSESSSSEIASTDLAGRAQRRRMELRRPVLVFSLPTQAAYGSAASVRLRRNDAAPVEHQLRDGLGAPLRL
jgi:hypothetical protein